jgi:hypothetical protein
MTAWNPITTHADPNSHLKLTDCPKKNNIRSLSTQHSSAEVFSGYLYVARMTRSELMYAITAASRYCENPGKPHWGAVKRSLSYLAGTMYYRLYYGGDQPTNTLVAYTDSYFAACPDSRRLTSGTLFMFNGGPIAWNSHLQKSLAQSTCEAEYYAARLGSRSIVWLKETSTTNSDSSKRNQLLSCAITKQTN